MRQIRVSSVAVADMDEIWLYIARDNVDAADKLIYTIVSRFSRLAAKPDFGRPREELSAGLRSLPVGRYVVFYRPIQSGVEIVRVLHGARDLPPLFE